MKREFLKELELTDEVIDKIMAENGKDIEKHKTQSETVRAELDTVKGQLAEANKQIEGFKDLDVDGIKKAADEWKEKYETAEKDYRAKVAEMEFDNLLGGKLADVKFTSEYAKKGVFEEIKGKGLKVENGSILGFDEVFNAIKEAQPNAFESDNPQPKFSDHTKTQTPIGSDAFIASMRKAAGLKE